MQLAIRVQGAQGGWRFFLLVLPHTFTGGPQARCWLSEQGRPTIVDVAIFSPALAYLEIAGKIML